jgi:chaperonin GroES
MEKKIKPIGDRILVKPIEDDEQKKGGIIIPDSAKEKPQEAFVISLGTGKKDIKGIRQSFDVQVGDKILISKYGGTEIKFDGVQYLLMREEDILAVID